ncbi:MAG: hypothetical protein ABEJ73_11135 [Haloplanus sp.]
MFDDTGRRRFLQLAGTGTTLSLAGCSAFSNHEGGSGGGEETTVTLAVQPDQQSLQELQSEIQSRVQSGELDRRQAQAEFRQRRIELTTDAVDTFQNRTGNTSVTVDNTIAEFGVLLVTGSPAALIETLSYEEVSGLFPAATFEEAQAQSGGGTATPGTATESG